MTQHDYLEDSKKTPNSHWAKVSAASLATFGAALVGWGVAPSLILNGCASKRRAAHVLQQVSADLAKRAGRSALSIIAIPIPPQKYSANINSPH